MRAPGLASLGLPLGLLLAGCTTNYWTRPGATQIALVEASDACYRQAVMGEVPAEMASGLPAPDGPGVLPPTVAPPYLWKRTPATAGFTRWQEQIQYETCMRRQGWRATRPPGHP